MRDVCPMSNLIIWTSRRYQSTTSHTWWATTNQLCDAQSCRKGEVTGTGDNIEYSISGFNYNRIQCFMELGLLSVEAVIACVDFVWLAMNLNFYNISHELLWDSSIRPQGNRVELICFLFTSSVIWVLDCRQFWQKATSEIGMMTSTPVWITWDWNMKINQGALHY